jgi:predicted Zn-dependent protease
MRRYLLILFLAGCAVRPPQPTTPVPAEPPPPPPETPIARENVAIAGLMESARADAASGKLVQAAASLERALRSEPRNPRLWHELARVRLRQGDTAQAANLAARSNSYAGSDAALRAANQNIIEQARTSR